MGVDFALLFRPLLHPDAAELIAIAVPPRFETANLVSSQAKGVVSSLVFWSVIS